MSHRVLMVMMEPTPYIDGLIENLRSVWDGGLDCVFVGKDLSQTWDETGLTHRTLPRRLLPGARDLARLIQSERHDLIHVAGWGHALLAFTIILGRALGIPVTVESDTPIRPHRGWWRALFRRLVYPILFRLPRLFLPGGTRQAGYLRFYGVHPERIRIAQMTVDTDAIRVHRARMAGEDRRAARLRLGLSDGQVAFLYVGRLEPHKGLHNLLVAFEGLSRGPDLHAALVIVGDGSMAAKLRSVARRHPCLLLTGRLAGQALRDAYCAADVFVLPSTDEPWGLVVNEAMAAGLPTILTDAVGCIDDLLEDGVTGIAVRTGSTPDLESAMRRIAGDAVLRASMGRAAERKIRPWTLRNEAQRVASAWSEALGQ